MQVKSTLAGFVISCVAIATPVTVAAGPAHAEHAGTSVAAEQLACTKTSSGSCIRGGQFCPQAMFNKSGWDAAGRRYVCKGDRSHPHWMKP